MGMSGTLSGGVRDPGHSPRFERILIQGGACHTVSVMLQVGNAETKDEFRRGRRSCRQEQDRLQAGLPPGALFQDDLRMWLKVLFAPAMSTPLGQE